MNVPLVNQCELHGKEYLYYKQIDDKHVEYYYHGSKFIQKVNQFLVLQNRGAKKRQ